MVYVKTVFGYRYRRSHISEFKRKKYAHQFIKLCKASVPDVVSCDIMSKAEAKEECDKAKTIKQWEETQCIKFK